MLLWIYDDDKLNEEAKKYYETLFEFTLDKIFLKFI
jgi:hypothetical protein